MSLRITGGHWRSRKLLRPQTSATRPMPDKVKQAIFNILGCRFELPGLLPPLRVADVFAGSGSMGLEALSRGCESCVFYESDRVALRSLRENIEALGAQDLAVVKPADAWRKAAQDAGQGQFELVFLDPPYRESQQTDAEGPLGRFLSRIADDSHRSQVTVPLVVLHHSSKVGYLQLPVPGPWVIWDERRMGGSGVTFFMDRADFEGGPRQFAHGDPDDDA